MKKLVIVGNGGFAKEVEWLVERINAVSPTWEFIGFIDKDCSNSKVIGDDKFVIDYDGDLYVSIAIGTSGIREKIYSSYKNNPNIHFPNLIDPSVLLSKRVSFGEGNIICAGSILTVDISIGNCNIINLDCTVGHDAIIGDFVTINPSVNVSGNTTIESGTNIGTGTQIIQGLSVGKNTIVGAGAVVSKELPANCTAVGIPAKVIKVHSESEWINERLLSDVGEPKMIIRTVTVIGVTGTMGANIAGIFASLGDAKVYCVGRDINKVKKTIPRIVKSVKADAIAKNLVPADFSSLDECVSQSDFIFESSKEDIKVKTEIATRVGKAMKFSAISGTGSSGLSITTIAERYPEELRARFFGIHMFNPPYTLPLCEMIPTKYSDGVLKEELREYLSKKLLRTVVEVKDSPAFLGNRIGFQFINEALIYAEKYKDNGGIDYIDSLLGSFTGRTMAPLTTSDFVGLDVHKAIVNNIYENTHDYAHDTFVLPSFASQLVEEGKLGRKSGCGLYQRIKYENGLVRDTVYDINTGLYRDIIPYVFPFADKMKKNIQEGDYQKAFERLVNNHSQEAQICLSFLLKYVVYSLYATEEVGYNITAADDVMATGFNWCPPLAMYQALFTVADVPALIKERLPEICQKIDVAHYLADVKSSKYDYRIYFKSGRKN